MIIIVNVFYRRVMKDDQTLKDVQHKDFIWTWKSNARGAKVSLWLPYFSNVEKIPRTKTWRLAYNGGALLVDLKDIDFIMFYGASGDLPLAFLDALDQHRIPLMVHRCHRPYPYVFYPANRSDDNDVLTAQILLREHAQKRAYVARTLIRNRFANFSPVLDVLDGDLTMLRQAKTIADIRQIEAMVTAKYWQRWYRLLGVDETRRSTHPLSQALDAGSKFISGILLRWTLFHKLSPMHGFLHEPTAYPALIYDLMEPYRYIIENAVAQSYRALPSTVDAKKLVGTSIKAIKTSLDTPVYVPATRQYVRRKNLLHGGVLSLRSYLLRETRRLVLPIEGVKKGGRPPQIA